MIQLYNCLLRLIVLHTCSQYIHLLENGFHTKKKCQNKIQLSQLDETLNDFVIGNGTTVNTMANEGLELQANGYHQNLRGLLRA